MIVDAARLPVYLANEWSELATRTGVLAIALTTGGVLAGTLFGRVRLVSIPEQTLHRVLGGALVVIGALVFLRGC